LIIQAGAARLGRETTEDIKGGTKARRRWEGAKGRAARVRGDASGAPGRAWPSRALARFASEQVRGQA
jgi:hypothetical protein